MAGCTVQVTAFSRWERELPKLLGDPRYTGLPSMKERRAVFDAFCKAVPSMSKLKSEGKRAALEAFQALLAEAKALPGAPPCAARFGFHHHAARNQG